MHAILLQPLLVFEKAKDILIHLPLERTELVLAEVGDTIIEPSKSFYAATALVYKSFHCKKFAPIRTILSAIKQENVLPLTSHIFYFILKNRSEFHGLTVSLISHDKDKCISAKLFRKLSGAKKPTSRNFIKFLKHHSVDSQQFAKTINELLPKADLDEGAKRDLVRLTGSFDIPALKEHIKSKDLQKRFLQYFSESAVSTDLDSAWSSLVPRRSDRCEESRKKHARLVLKQLTQILVNLIPTVLFEIIAYYAA